jgi:S-adenosylmethionine-diacylglycerol 3-amino-3-carboxypropyl transferase
MSVANWVSGRVFNLVHRHNLVYNTCWEDPRLDRQALELGPNDTVLVITSAGCNALDYALTEPKHVYAVDVNPRQNALLELKLAGIRNLDFETFFGMFGEGRLKGARDLYRDKLRGSLSEWAQKYWDRRIKFFDSKRRTFYFRGTSGTFARMMNIYADRVLRLRPWVDAILAAETLSEQRRIYEEHLRDRIWTRLMRFLMNRDTTLSMVGVPRAQRFQIETQYEGGIIKFIQDCLDAVFGQLPLADNYFWRVYVTGSYTRLCCPEYLKAKNFEQLKGGLADRISVSTDTVEGAHLPLRPVGSHGLALGQAFPGPGKRMGGDPPAGDAAGPRYLAERRPEDRLRGAGSGDGRRAGARAGRAAPLSSPVGRRAAPKVSRAHLRQLLHCRSGRLSGLRAPIR